MHESSIAAKTGNKEKIEAVLASVPCLARASSYMDRVPTAEPELTSPETVMPLFGSLPRGCIVEVAGPPGSGCTSLAMALAAHRMEKGEHVSWIDPVESLCPAEAAKAGVDTRALLWVRPGSVGNAFKAADVLLESRSMDLIVLDMAFYMKSGSRVTHRPATWLKLARKAEVSTACLLVLARKRLVGSFATLAIELGQGLPIRSGWPGRAVLGIESRWFTAKSRWPTARHAGTIHFRLPSYPLP